MFPDKIQRRTLKKEEHPHIPDNIIENFPFPKPRPGQLDIINDIYEAIEEGYKYIILEAGTGTGKSAIATTLTRIYKPAYILTMTKQLQDQYVGNSGSRLLRAGQIFIVKVMISNLPATLGCARPHHHLRISSALTVSAAVKHYFSKKLSGTLMETKSISGQRNIASTGNKNPML